MRPALILEGALHTCLEANNKSAVILELVLLAEHLRLWSVNLCHVSLQAREQSIADGPLLGTGGQQVNNFLQLALVIEQQVAACTLNGSARNLRRDKRIAVAIATDP